MKVKQVVEFFKCKTRLFLLLYIAILFGLIGGGYYYWWRGTPEYSISQIKKAIEINNSKLQFKYIDVDNISENMWVEMKNRFMLEADGFGTLGMMMFPQMVDGVKLSNKEMVKKGIESELLLIKMRLESGTIWQKAPEIKRHDNFAYIELSDNVKIILTKKEGGRYWVISKIEGYLESIEKSAEKTDVELVANGFKEKQAYIDKVEIRDVHMGKSVLDETGVFGEIKNLGDRTLTDVQITIYCLDKNGKAVFERTHHPVLVSEYSLLGDNKPLKPNYSEKFGVRLNDAPSDWANKVRVKVTDIEFEK